MRTDFNTHAASCALFKSNKFQGGNPFKMFKVHSYTPMISDVVFTIIPSPAEIPIRGRLTATSTLVPDKDVYVEAPVKYRDINDTIEGITRNRNAAFHDPPAVVSTIAAVKIIPRTYPLRANERKGR